MGIHTCLVAIKILRAGDGYQGTVGPPEVSSQWSTDHPYGRDELRWKIESMGAHPIDAADPFPAADVRRDSALKASRDHGVTGDVRVAMSRPLTNPHHQTIRDGEEYQRQPYENGRLDSLEEPETVAGLILLDDGHMRETARTRSDAEPAQNLFADGVREDRRTELPGVCGSSTPWAK
jgi:hypothetical protein